jgi:phytoene dehydrogenase-like protein
MMFAWFNQKNAGYLIGGSLPMAKRMTNRYLNLGGKLTTRAKVTKIQVVNNNANVSTVPWHLKENLSL